MKTQRSTATTFNLKCGVCGHAFAKRVWPGRMVALDCPKCRSVETHIVHDWDRIFPSRY